MMNTPTVRFLARCFRQVKDQFMEHVNRGSASQVPRVFDPRAEMERLKAERKRNK